MPCSRQLISGWWCCLLALAACARCGTPQALDLHGLYSTDSPTRTLTLVPAVGIGRAEQICPLIFAWDGFWQAAPTDQQQRLASYALRMLGSAAVSYAALPREAVERCRRCAAMSETVCGFKAASRPAATPHFVKACLFSACLQLLATRPQYLPAVEGFLGICGSGSCRGLQADLLNAIDALFSAAASAGQFASLAPPPRGGLAIARHRSVGGRLQGSPAEDSSGSPRSGGSGSGLGAVLRRMKTSLSLRFASPGQTPGGRLALSRCCFEGRCCRLCTRCWTPAQHVAAPCRLHCVLLPLPCARAGRHTQSRCLCALSLAHPSPPPPTPRLACRGVPS